MDEPRQLLSDRSTTTTSSTDLTDKRLDQISLDSMDIPRPGLSRARGNSGDHMEAQKPGAATHGLQTKGRYMPLDWETTESSWGIVHLYRDAEETPGLYGDSPLSRPADPWLHGYTRDTMPPKHKPPSDDDCTMLCILAVPSYMPPSDFLGFVGEKTIDKVSHLRMIKTSRANRYMVLMKFRHGKEARAWQLEWNGKIFNHMEPETCHVVFLKSVEVTLHTKEVQTASTISSAPSYPNLSNDPFNTTTSKPLAPRTPALVELPTCPVCLERMDETTGLLTILCQHVFHCTCLQKWSGGGCPVCRYTHDDFSSRPGTISKLKNKKYLYASPEDYGEDDPVMCETCGTENNPWQCLLCGKVGCGRYDSKHAYKHFEETGHAFSLDMQAKRVWNYAGDNYVHRIIQDAGDGADKLVELPGSRRDATPALEDDYEDHDANKSENLALEYTHLLTSQLESQRVYFEEKVSKTADKATSASNAAASAVEAAAKAQAMLSEMQQKYDELASNAHPALEREKSRLERRSEKFETMARDLEKSYREEKSMNARLMERIQHISKETEGLKAAKVDLEEQNRDLTFFISSSEKLRNMGEAEGGEELGEEIREGTVSVPDPATGKKKGKGKRK